MKKSARALVGLVVIDGLLLLGTTWMVIQTKSGAWSSPDPAGAITTITSTMGGAIGIVTAILLMAAFVHWRRGN